MGQQIENVVAGETGKALSAELVRNGWEPTIFYGDVVTKRARKHAMMYRDATSGEYRIVAQVSA